MMTQAAVWLFQPRGEPWRSMRGDSASASYSAPTAAVLRSDEYVS